MMNGRIEHNPLVQKQYTQLGNSRVLLVVVSKNYASWRWCLNELLEIMKCQENLDQRFVVAAFYGIAPNDLQEPRENRRFVLDFDETYADDDSSLQNWAKALSDVCSLYEERPIGIINSGRRGLLSNGGLEDSIFVNDIKIEVSRALRSQNGRFWYGKANIFFLYIILLLEIASVYFTQCYSKSRPHCMKIALGVSISSVLCSVVDNHLKTLEFRARNLRVHPDFFDISPGLIIKLGNRMDFLLFCGAVGELAVTAINCGYIDTGRDPPILFFVWPSIVALGSLVFWILDKFGLKGPVKRY